MYKIFIDNEWVDSEVEPSDGQRYITTDAGGGTVQSIWSSVEPVEVIRIITTGSMQRRFSITEEVTIDEGNDTMSKVIKSRLMNADYCDLDFPETQQGIAHIVNFLNNQGALLNGVTPVERVDKLLSDGTNEEKYRGIV